ncbi:virulence RhuM family protein [Deltaproteobacteria bacterium OttesenSCG-928-K17]|nr:virulence RhuM family protein [Deltaproteobacteria bacterium OttesenSCG-928-K17]
MTNSKLPLAPAPESFGELLLYQADDLSPRLEVRLYEESIWLTINQMAMLFQVDKSGVSRHLKNIFDTGELERNSVVAKFATTAADNKTYQVEYFNLDAIISVGYRVNSLQGTKFRIWATQRLREYLVKGFTIDDQRLKEPGSDRYFEELLARIRDIRSSEKVFWRKVLDIYATSIDYDSKSDLTKDFFKKVQNQMHWAAHGHTAAELIHGRADAEKPNMGLTNFPGRRVLKRDIEVAKNYLQPEELEILNRMVTAYLELAELQALNRTPMAMKDWSERLRQFLAMTGREVLNGSGRVTHDEAIAKARREYEKYQKASLEQPSEVEKDFIEAEKTFKRLEKTKSSNKPQTSKDKKKTD